MALLKEVASETQNQGENQAWDQGERGDVKL
jgi:hypothetical protein